MEKEGSEITLLQHDGDGRLSRPGRQSAIKERQGRMLVIRFDEAEPYEPPGHSGVVNRLLVGRASGEVSEVSVWHGLIDPGGRADPHAHDDAVQIYVIVSGILTIACDDASVELGPGDAVVFAAGERHEVYNADASVAALHVISAPALR